MTDRDGGSSGLADRLSELEARLADMEHERSASGRSRALMRRMIPAEASTHFRAAGREQLLGIRALVDHWIRRLEAGDAPRAEREEIPID